MLFTLGMVDRVSDTEILNSAEEEEFIRAKEQEVCHILRVPMLDNRR